MTDLDNNMLKKETTITPFNIRFESQDEVGLKIVSLIEYLDKPFLIYEDITVPVNEYTSEEIQFKFETSEKRMLSTELEYHRWRYHRREISLPRQSRSRFSHYAVIVRDSEA